MSESAESIKIHPWDENIPLNAKMIIVGAPGAGKTVLTKRIVEILARRNPTTLAFNGSEKLNNNYSGRSDDGMVPRLFVYPRFDSESLKMLERRQEIADEIFRLYGISLRTTVIVDDCADNAKSMKSEHFVRLFKLGRHMNLDIVVILQYAIDVPPSIRSASDITFVFNDATPTNRKKMYDNYSISIPNLAAFNSFMDSVVNKNKCAVFLKRSEEESSNIPKRVFWYKAPFHGDDYSPQVCCAAQRAWARENSVGA